MIGKAEENPQLNVFRIPLVNVINMKHELVELAQRIDWKLIEKDFVKINFGTFICYSYQVAIKSWGRLECYLLYLGFINLPKVDEI